MTAETILNPVKPCKKCQVATERNSRGNCKACASASRLAYRVGNPGKVKASDAAWRIANPDKCKARHDTWRAANPGRRKASGNAYYAANASKVKACNAARMKANPELARIKTHNRKARKLANGGVLSKGLSAKLFKLQRGKCACCNEPLGDNYHLDHIMPFVLGGKNIDSNIQLLRQRCNNQKYSKHPVDFMQSRGFLL